MTTTALEYFSLLVQEDDSIPLFEAALSIAQDSEPELDLNAVQAEVDTLAQRLIGRTPMDATPIQKLRLLNHFFYQELGFAGNVNDYYSAENSYLHRVLHSRRGIPISLAILYMEFAQQIGLNIKGINFPGHFLMKLGLVSGEIILDPFNGNSLTREELEERVDMICHGREVPPETSLSTLLAVARPRDILARLLRNLKALFTESPYWDKALDVHQRLIILLPENTRERRDRGLTYAHLDCPQAALNDLEAYLADYPDAEDALRLRAQLPALRQACRRLN